MYAVPRIDHIAPENSGDLITSGTAPPRVGTCGGIGFAAAAAAAAGDAVVSSQQYRYQG